jgi:dGTPase
VDYTAHDTARLVPEPDKIGSGSRSAYERDRARVLHSAALRRLAAKTQVVGVGEDDFPRTRLTHSLECAQIGRELAGALGADPDLVDAACLAHDLGHPPFGHNGETALDEAAAECGGFEGNAQSFRVLTRLEAKVLADDGSPAGLNLTRATLDATLKYPWARGEGGDTPKFGVYADDRAAFEWAREGVRGHDRCLEATVMDWADDVAYSVHDLEDGVQAGQIELASLRDDEVGGQLAALASSHYLDATEAELGEALAALLRLPWWPARHDGGVADQVSLKRATSELIGRFCAAAVIATRTAHGDEPMVRYAAALVVPRDVRLECALLKAMTLRFVMSRPDAMERQVGERAAIARLVEATEAGAPDTLDPMLRDAWRHAADDAARRRVVVDDVAGLSDTAAWRLDASLTGLL